MNYYQEVIDKIEKLLSQEKYEEASLIVNEELSVAYVPNDFLNKLNEYLGIIKQNIHISTSLSDDELEKYLFLDNEHQLVAVSELCKKNLRDYIPLCNRYLSSDTFKNGKVFLIDSLINQEINEEMKYIQDGIEYSFIPKYILPIESSDGYIHADKIISDVYLKEPSKYKMAKELLFKECLMSLPINYDYEEGSIIAQKIIKYIDNAFA